MFLGKRPARPIVNPNPPVPPTPQVPDRPHNNVELDPYKRFRSNIYDPQHGKMRPGDLLFHPHHKDTAYLDPNEKNKIIKDRMKNLVEGGYEPFKVMEGDRDTGMVEWHRWDELVQVVSSSALIHMPGPLT